MNGIPHQAMWPRRRRRPGDFYGQVYDWFPDRTFDDVLIVGAGSGTDVAVALAKGAEQVDAVEIDPVIQQIGTRTHPDRAVRRPAGQLRSTTTAGRSSADRQRYDLVVFALPDSLTLVSTSANLRLESFLFTDRGVRDVRDRLAPDGVFVLYNYYREDWLPQKIGGMLEEASARRRSSGATGTSRRDASRSGPASTLVGGQPPGDRVDAVDLGDGAPARDRRLAVPVPPRAVRRRRTTSARSAIILAFARCLVLARARKRPGTSLRRFSPHFFLLGVAFLLLETRSLVTFSLLFGSTWLVNSLVFFAVLRACCWRSLINARFRIRNPMPLYVALLVSIVIACLVPPDRSYRARRGCATCCVGRRVRAGLLRQPRLQPLVP